MDNTLWDYLGQNYPWVGHDLDSQAKFRLGVSKRFEMTIAEVDAAISERFAVVLEDE